MNTAEIVCSILLLICSIALILIILFQKGREREHVERYHGIKFEFLFEKQTRYP